MQFGNFDEICNYSPLPICNLIATPRLNGPSCYARSIEVGMVVVFQPATILVQLIAVVMTLVMIYNIKIKYTAVGRKEMVLFFYLYLLMLILECVVISGWISAGSSLYPYFVSGYYGLVSATVCCLMLNGFVGFQFAEDGTFWSVWSLRFATLIVFCITFVINLGTFMDTGLSRTYPTVLWIWLFLVQGLALIIYSGLQIILVVNTLDIYWPIGNIILGGFFFLLGQTFLYLLSTQICYSLNHYIDGMFFYVICNLLSVMMIYKYWDSITKEDLEFSVSNSQNVWEVKSLSNPSNRNSLITNNLDLEIPKSVSTTTLPSGQTRDSTFIAAISSNRSLHKNTLTKLSKHLLSPTINPEIRSSPNLS